MSRTDKNTPRVAITGGLMAVALLAAGACRAGDGPTTAPAAPVPSSTSAGETAPARTRIPPPRGWTKGAGPIVGGPTRDSAPRFETVSASTSASSVRSQSEERPPSAAFPESSQAPDPSAPQASSLAQAMDLIVSPDEVEVDLAATRSKIDGRVNQVGCATCGGFHRLGDGTELHQAIGCPGGRCIPGRKSADSPGDPPDTVVGAFMRNLYECLCCPDPCYQPRWVPEANASFFADYARPRTVTRLRYDNLEAMTRPDRNQYWIRGVVALRKNGRPVVDPRARLQQFYIYQEAAGERGSFFIEYPYRQINQSYAPTQAGFSDLNFGIKSLMFDCELLQIAFQFRTFTPTGDGSLNLGTGHFSLDPSILASLKLGPSTYFQGQFGNWIPLAGNQNLAGGMFYSLMSVNQVVCYPTPDSPLIATLEMDAWSFENGGYTAAIKPGQTSAYVEKGGGVSYFNIGPGLRQSVCNRLDFGGALTWATSSAHWAQPWFRFEARFLF